MKKILCVAGLALAICGSVYAGGQSIEPAAPVSSWTGLYVGLNGGYTWANADTDFTGAGGLVLVPSTVPVHQTGGLFGAQLGYDWQLGEKVVIGMETDIDWSGLKGSSVLNGTANGVGIPDGLTASQKTTYVGTIRPILGFLPMSDWLIYATGGGAYAHMNDSANTVTAAASYPSSRSVTQWGWAVGGGTEYKFTDTWSGGLMYLFYDLDDVKATGTAVPAGATAFTVLNRFTSSANVIRADVNYRFSA